MSTVRTRFAPSPTGYLHVGGARTALFSWLYARRFGGQFVLRVEDTDLERSSEAANQAILQGLQWLGLDFDEGPYYQTQRFDRYRQVAEQLLEAGLAYHCYCSQERVDEVREAARRQGLKPRYDGHCRERQGAPPGDVTPVVRFKNPLDGEVVFEDRVFGRIAVANSELDDLVLMRRNGAPMYNFAVVVDDSDMGITHVIRGEDHVNNTPRQINILQALDAAVPVYAHVPLIRGNDGKKLSKRHGAVAVTQYREQGFLPEAMLNYLARLGWSHGDEEIFDLERLTQLFDIADVNRAASVFDHDKLRWLNQHYVKAAGSERLQALLSEQLVAMGLDAANGPPLADTVEALRERAPTLADMAHASDYFYAEIDAFDEKSAKKHLSVSSGRVLQSLQERLAAVDTWRAESLHAAVLQVSEELGLKLG
ncbi:MAG: glutamate--tRNA ligase, partial [Gammaproteobacteria bacterium]|nr:glutamate--tRNA ligase [Gammaproteobacteria bacterium]